MSLLGRILVAVGLVLFAAYGIGLLYVLWLIGRGAW